VTRLPPLPGELRWAVEPVRWEVEGGALVVTAGPRTDLFVSPSGDPPRTDAPLLVTALAGDFVLGARVRVGFGATWDAGALVVLVDESRWGKLAFEYSPQSEPMIVSVVNRGRSDDANAFTVDGDEVWLRVARLGPAFAFHASTDGERWRFVRHFELGAVGDVEAGFLAQAPTGDACTAVFEDVFFRAEALADLRDGS
jgi:regulation of enolase protein 1 (concanavalin A-like superfamily)